MFYLLGATRREQSIRDLPGEYRALARGGHGPKFISLFSGAMGLDLGLESAGFSCLGCLEMNPWACATIRHNRPGLPIIEDDIRQWNDGARLLAELDCRPEDVALIAGGPPCPSFSTAGKRQAFNDPRGQVMFDFLKIIDEIRPVFFVMENVRGILSAALDHVPLAGRKNKIKYDGKGGVMSLLSEKFAAMGYSVTAELVNAASYGVPQKRERVVFLGSRDGLHVTMPAGGYGPEETFFQRRWRTLGDAVAGLVDEPPEFLPFSPARKRFLTMLSAGQNWRNLPPEMQSEALGGAYTSTGGRVGFFRRLSLDEPSPTVPASPIQKSTCLCHPQELRPLSVKEYARVQQFPDDWHFMGSTVEKYRQIGNAVPVGLGHVIGATLMKYIENLACA